MDKKEITINKNYIYHGAIINLRRDDVLVNGKKALREMVEHPGGAAILGITKENKIILERQFRYPYNDFIYEIPAGKLEKNEDPKLAAIREFEEETGYKAKEIQDFGKLYPTVGYSNEIIYLFLTTNFEAGKQHFDEDEYVDVLEVSLEEAKDMIYDGRILDSKTQIAILKYLNMKGK